MAVAISNPRVTRLPELTRRYKRIACVGTAAGTYVAGGFIFDLTALKNPTLFPAAYPGRVPDDVEVSLPAGYIGKWVPNGTPTLANGMVQVWSAAGTELAAGALPAALIVADAIGLTLKGPIGAF